MQPVPFLLPLVTFLAEKAAEAIEVFARLRADEHHKGKQHAQAIAAHTKELVRQIEDRMTRPVGAHGDAAAEKDDKSLVAQVRDTAEEVWKVWTDLARQALELGEQQHPQPSNATGPQYQYIEAHLLTLRQRLQELHRQQTVPAPRPTNLIKVHVTLKNKGRVKGESVWAERVSANTARICNIPYCTNTFTRGDLVEIDQDREYVRTLMCVGRTRHAVYEIKPGNFARLSYDRLALYLYLHDITAEGAEPGFVALFVPAKISDADFTTICQKSPVPIRPCGPKAG